MQHKKTSIVLAFGTYTAFAGIGLASSADATKSMPIYPASEKQVMLKAAQVPEGDLSLEIERKNTQGAKPGDHETVVAVLNDKTKPFSVAEQTRETGKPHPGLIAQEQYTLDPAQMKQAMESHPQQLGLILLRAWLEMGS